MSREQSESDELVDVFKALGHPVRVRILHWLKDPEGEFGEYPPIADRHEVGVCASHIQAKSGLAQSTVSAYMATLERADLVLSTRVGKWTHYRRNEDALARFAKLIAEDL